MNEATMTDADMKQREKIVKSMKKNFKDFRKRYGAKAKSVMYATATKMAMKEAVKDEADKGEYDYEGDMAKSSLRTIVRNAQMMHDMLGEDTNLPEWVASKITLAEDYLVSAAQYMQSEMTEETQLDELSSDTLKSYQSKSIEQGNKVLRKEIPALSPKKFSKRVKGNTRASQILNKREPAKPKSPFNFDDVNSKKAAAFRRKHWDESVEVTQIDEYQKGLFNPPAGFTKKGMEKGGGIKTKYHYTGKSNTPSGATMKMGGVTVPMGKTPTKRRVKEEVEKDKKVETPKMKYKKMKSQERFDARYKEMDTNYPYRSDN